jgi:hypothetical protein
MLLKPKHDNPLDCLAGELRLAEGVTPDLVLRIIADACRRVPALTRSGKAAGLSRLIEAGAWTDVALALIELDLPAWKVRRLVHEDGEWHCALSKELSLPVALDDMAEASHEILPLAILSAFIEARRGAMTGCETRPASVRPAQAAPCYAMSCENFA